MIRPTSEKVPARPVLVDARMGKGRKLYLFIREGEKFSRRVIDLTKDGAGLYSVNCGFGTLALRRGRHITQTEPFLRERSVGLMLFGCTREVAEVLMEVLWGECSCLLEWNTPAECVQPAPDPYLDNAAD